LSLIAHSGCFILDALDLLDEMEQRVKRVRDRFSQLTTLPVAISLFPCLAVAAITPQPQTEEEFGHLRQSVNRGCPFGEDHWLEQVAVDLELQTTLRPREGPANNHSRWKTIPDPLVFVVNNNKQKRSFSTDEDD
jgi:hypothetical protein